MDGSVNPFLGLAEQLSQTQKSLHGNKGNNIHFQHGSVQQQGVIEPTPGLSAVSKNSQHKMLHDIF